MRVRVPPVPPFKGDEMKKTTDALGYSVNVRDEIEFEVAMDDAGVVSRMFINVTVSKIDDDDRIHFEHGYGTIIPPREDMNINRRV